MPEEERLDSDVIPKLKDNIGEFSNVTILEGDIMKMDIKGIIAEHFPGMRVAVAGNIPYNITSPLITELLSSDSGIESDPEARLHTGLLSRRWAV